MHDRDLMDAVVACVLADRGDPRDCLLPLIEAVTSDVARYPSNEHVLGFLHCRLGEIEGRTVRLHVWPADERSYGEPRWPIHTHHWQISSAVVAGYVVNEVFAVEEDAKEAHELYAVGYLGEGVSERRPSGRGVRVERTQVQQWGAGQRYNIPLGTYHSTTVPEGVFAATVIVTGVRTETTPLVVGDASGDARHRYAVRPVALARWSAALTQLARAMTLD